MRLRRGCSGLWIAVLAAVLDRAAKCAVLAADAGGVLWQLSGVVAIRRTANTGVAFSLFSGGGLQLAAGKEKSANSLLNIESRGVSL